MYLPVFATNEFSIKIMTPIILVIVYQLINTIKFS